MWRTNYRKTLPGVEVVVCYRKTIFGPIYNCMFAPSLRRGWKLTEYKLTQCTNAFTNTHTQTNTILVNTLPEAWRLQACDRPKICPKWQTPRNEFIHCAIMCINRLNTVLLTNELISNPPVWQLQVVLHCRATARRRNIGTHTHHSTAAMQTYTR